MRFLYQPYLWLFLLAMVSCKSIFDYQKQPKDRPHLLVHGYTAPGKPLAMRVGKINPGAENANATQPAPKASVTISWKGATETELIPKGEGFFQSKDWKPRAGRNYEVNVSHPEIQSIKANAELPKPIRVSVSGLKVVKRLDKGDPLLYQMDIEWTDPPNDTNYYEIRAYATLLDENGQVAAQPPATLLASQPGYQKRETNGLLIHDRNLDDTEVSIPVFADARFDVEGRLAGFRVELRHVNKAYFENQQSLPPTLPSQPASRMFKQANNIEDGFGYIAGYTSSSASVGAY